MNLGYKSFNDGKFDAIESIIQELVKFIID